MNYQKGKIYKIESHLGPKIYIGSTTKDYLSQRMTAHRNSYSDWKKGKYNNTRSFQLFEEYGIENCSIILLELCPCNTKDELTKRESHYIRTLECVNKVIPDRTSKEWRNENKEKAHEYNIQYRIDKKEEMKEKQKQYRETNKEDIKNKKKAYYEDNKDKILEKVTQYRSENKEKIKERKSEPFKCDCGSCFRINDRARHERTKKHLNYLASKTE